MSSDFFLDSDFDFVDVFDFDLIDLLDNDFFYFFDVGLFDLLYQILDHQDVLVFDLMVFEHLPFGFDRYRLILFLLGLTHFFLWRSRTRFFADRFFAVRFFVDRFFAVRFFADRFLFLWALILLRSVNVVEIASRYISI